MRPWCPSDPVERDLQESAMSFDLPTGINSQDQMLWCIGVAARLDTAVEASLRDMGRFLAHGMDLPAEMSDIWGGIGSKRGLLTELELRLAGDSRVSDEQRTKWGSILGRADAAHLERNRLIHDDWWPSVLNASGHPALWHRQRRAKADGTPYPSENFRTLDSFLECAHTLDDVLLDVVGQFQSTAMSVDREGYDTWWTDFNERRRGWKR